MKTFKAPNGINMLKCQPLNFQVQHTYRDNTGPLFYSISVGGMAEMHSCLYKPEDGVVSIASLAYSDDYVLRFKVTSFEEASKLIKQFADGMGVDMSGTIYTL